MCGIVGFVNREAAARREVVEAMNERIIHRGPDDDGFYVNGSVALAMRRLSIIDLAGGKQPISNKDKTKWIVFNGEIYNYRELRKEMEERGHRFETHSDTEVIVKLYDELGPDSLQQLRGMFAIAIWDENDRSLFLARDRVGKKPLLYSHQPDGSLIFGSEFRALLKHPSVSREVDNDAIDSYMSFMCIPAPQTAFKSIRKLEPGHWMRWKDGRIETHRYWLPDFTKKIKISERDAMDETIRIIREAVKLRMISDVPLGAFLSGGVDSSTVVAIMAEESSVPVKTFSIGFEDEDFSELKYAKRVAEHVGAEYNEFIVRPDAAAVIPLLVDHYGEPYADSSALPSYYVSRETRRHVTVALNGDGGDESFAGYDRYMAMQLAELYRRVPLRKLLFEPLVNALPSSEEKKTLIRDAQRFLVSANLGRAERYFHWMSVFKQRVKDRLYTADFKQQVAANRPRHFLDQWYEKAGGAGLLDSTLLTDQMTYLPNDLLVKVDIVSMANSLEGRSPLLDHKLIEFAASLPEHLKVNKFRTKYLLKKIAARFVPREVVYRRKMGFGVPIGRWFRKDLKDMAYSTLLSDKAAGRGIFERAEVKRMLDRHVSFEEDASHQIWTLLMLEMWFRRFIDKD
ncbi:MAG: asparagine synthase (glutamine-hydrolyzing) [Pyrinomonadaceae bacterium]|nr:asparagine synthase (glutamine-hydrolyzing) [Pyrinomonadaceae bacterium]